MKTAFYIHGVPKGQEIWGSEEDRGYIKSFYSSSYNEQIRFVVEIIPAKKKAYYTYLRAKNVYGSENREGSYFGITISLNGVYCTDNENLYALFDQIFNQKIVGTLLNNQNGNYRFVSSTFENKTKEIEAIKNLFLQQLEGSFKEDVENIDGSFVASSNNQTAFFNIADVDSSLFFSTLKKTLKVYISPEYPTKDSQIASLRKQIEPEKAKNKQLSEENAELKQQLTTATNSNKSYLSELSQLKADKQKLDEDNKKLRSENASLKSDLERNKAKNSIERSVGQIRQPLEDLLKGVKKLTPSSTYDEHHYHHDYSNSEKVDSKFEKIRSWIIDVVVIIMFALVLIISYCMFFETKWTKPIITNKEAKADPKPQSKPAKSYVVMKVDGEQVEPSKEYTATLVNPPQGVNIKWRIDGADVPNGKKNENTITFKPLADKDSVYLTSCVIINGNESVIEKRVWAIKKQ